jgi:hypothetical protein
MWFRDSTWLRRTCRTIGSCSGGFFFSEPCSSQTSNAVSCRGNPVCQGGCSSLLRDMTSHTCSRERMLCRATHAGTTFARMLAHTVQPHADHAELGAQVDAGSEVCCPAQVWPRSVGASCCVPAPRRKANERTQLADSAQRPKTANLSRAADCTPKRWVRKSAKARPN